MLESAVAKAERGADLTISEAEQVIDFIVGGNAPQELVARLLIALHTKGVTPEELAGAAQAMRKHMLVVSTDRPNVMDIVGTGGDGAGTFNISTAAAIVVAAAGVPVAKHGNRRITSRTGSADVLAELGVNVEAPLAVVTECLAELGICFCFAPLLHPAMKNVAEVRRQLGHPTIFNLLGPLTNPAQVRYQLVGVGRAYLRPLLAESLRLLGTARSAVVYGDGNLDEVSLSGPTAGTLVDGEQLTEFSWNPADFGLAEVPLESLQVSGPQESAQKIREIVEGVPGPITDCVLANAAAALVLAGAVRHLAEGVVRAREAIASGAAKDLLARWIEKTRQASLS